jgi:DNA modification methylase
MTSFDGVNSIRAGDCIAGMAALPAGCVDLAFADPPFNIGYEYDVYDDKQKGSDYLNWARRWIGGVHRVLKPNGTFWLAIGDEYAAELKLASQDIGFRCRSWVIWYYTFGVNCKQKFSRSHAHLFYFVKDPKGFTFRCDELENRIPSARQLVYADNRANPNGRLPDDTWVLRPQDLGGCFTPDEDTWYFPRVAGTFKERAGFHGCQMPEQLLGRIIRLCSDQGDLVFDPFSGSATTAAVAKKLGRQYLAFDLSEEYVERGKSRLEAICVGDPLDGAPEPTLSAPSTPKHPTKSKARSVPVVSRSTVEADRPSPDQVKIFHEGLLEAFRRTYDGFSLDRVVADPDMNERLSDACRMLGLPGEPRTWNWTLFGMRKAGLLVNLPAVHRTEFRWEDCEDYLFASEIALAQMIESGCKSLDSILCDPFVASQFDEIASRWAPEFKPLKYRWAAMMLRKRAATSRSRAEFLTDARFSRAIPLDNNGAKKFPDQSGVYVVAAASNRKPLYAGEASNLRQRLQFQFGTTTRPMWKKWESLTARYFATSCDYTDRLAYQHRLVVRERPELNYFPNQRIA